jgi:hypothetical protein
MLNGATGCPAPKETAPMLFLTVLPSFVALALVLALHLLSRRIGALNAASWLVVFGAVVMATEHPQFAVGYTVPWTEEQMALLPHARIHFFMAGIYTLLAAAAVSFIAFTLLREGRRSGWFAVLAALLIGGGFDLVMGGLWYQHGSPLYRLFGASPLGFGWEFLYVYLVAWGATLAISYRAVFAGPLKRPKAH